jgi:hypothetical protein
LLKGFASAVTIAALPATALLIDQNSARRLQVTAPAVGFKSAIPDLI